MFDNHIHTEISKDSSMEIQDAIDYARKKGLSLCLTEHIDIKNHNQVMGDGFTFVIPAYFEKYKDIKSHTLLLGVELGMRPEMYEDNKKALGNYEFDFILGSIHYVNGIDIYNSKFYQDKTKTEAFNLYLDDMLTCIKMYENFDSLGHIDYISRYATYKDSEIYYEEFKEKIDGILGTIIKKGKVIEINTRRLNQPGVKDNFLKIYGRYKELGGRFVTIGSDAHNKESVGINFEVAKDIIKKLDLQAVYFKNRCCIVDLDIK